MLAELHGKLSSDGNFSDRLEDQLTGDIFGALRYLPFERAMGPILSAARLPGLTGPFPTGPWAERFRFWPRHPLGELDGLLELDGALVGIEVKYHSGLSSEDQLEREGRILRDLAGERDPYLLFIAGADACISICKGVTLSSGVPLGWVSWQEVLRLLALQTDEDPFRQQIIWDMTALLRRKGFDGFQGFPGSEPTVCRDAWFPYQWKQTVAFAFPHRPDIQGGAYYVYR